MVIVVRTLFHLSDACTLRSLPFWQEDLFAGGLKRGEGGRSIDGGSS